MLVYQRPSDELIFYDGRETAPAGATPDMFMRGGEAMNFMAAWQTGISVGVPGAVAAYQTAHDAHGNPRRRVVVPASLFLLLLLCAVVVAAR